MSDDIYADLDRLTRPRRTASSAKSDPMLLRPLFGYPGGKSRSLEQILPHLPYRGSYIEPFGGSGAILIARNPIGLEVFNDRFAGVVAFYSCLRDPAKYEALMGYLDLVLHAREEFIEFQSKWAAQDTVQRAAMWYAMMQYSFANMGRNWGRATGALRSSMARKVSNKLAFFPRMHERFKNVQVENQDWKDCIQDYDAKDAVFYLDPPYVDARHGAHEHVLTPFQHAELIETIFSSKGFFAVSGYSCDMYENNPWDARYEWEAFVSLDPIAYAEGNGKVDIGKERNRATEVLWIKEAAG